jgi:hypothetical protein
VRKDERRILLMIAFTFWNTKGAVPPVSKTGCTARKRGEDITQADTANK